MVELFRTLLSLSLSYKSLERFRFFPALIFGTDLPFSFSATLNKKYNYVVDCCIMFRLPENVSYCAEREEDFLLFIWR